MKKRYLLLAAILILSGCSQTTSTPKKTTSSSSATSQSHTVKKTVPKATLGTLVGHAFVQTKDATKAIRVTSSTSGYYLETLAVAASLFAQLKRRILDHVLENKPVAHHWCDQRHRVQE